MTGLGGFDSGSGEGSDRFSPTGLAADLVRKILTVGVGAVFLTEESVRSLISEFKLPKELLAGVLESAAKTKNEFFSKLSADLLEKVGNQVDPRSMIQEVLAKNEVEVTMKIRFHPKKE